MVDRPSLIAAVGAALLVGGWGLMRLAETQQRFAGSDAGRWWDSGLLERSRLDLVSGARGAGVDPSTLPSWTPDDNAAGVN